MKVFVVFGSASDENVSAPLVKALTDAGMEAEFEVISAHRDLEKLQDRIAAWKGDAIVAGAGLAAALPGVVAAMTRLPVFGVPVPAQFGGLDSLASIAQMPPGVPVMSCGPHRADSIVAFLGKYRDAPRAAAIHFVAPDDATLSHPDLRAEVGKAEKLGAEKGIAVTAGTARNDNALNALFITKPEQVRAGDLCIHIPFMPKSETGRAENYLSVLALADRGGVWVGVNNARNAVQAAIRLKG